MKTALLLIGSLTHTLAFYEATKDFCIVGGGPSGIYAAHLLENAGYDVTVFDEGSVAGGKTVPFIDDNGEESFRHFIVRDDFTTLESFRQQYGLTEEIPVRELYQAHVLQDGQIAGYPEITPEIIALAQQYLATVSKPEIQVHVNKDTNEGIPPELMVSMREWLATNNLAPMEQLLFNIVTNFGYSFFEKVPAIYLLRYLTPNLVAGNFSPTTTTVKAPVHQVFVEMAKQLNDVRFNTRVSDILPGFSFIPGLLKHTGSSLPMVCKKTVLAFPQTPESMSIVHAHLSSRHFNMVENVYYYEVAIELPTYDLGYTNGLLAEGYIPTEEINRVNLYVVNKPYVVAYVNNGNTKQDQDSIIQVVLQRASEVFGQQIDETMIKFYKEQIYFPHVNSQDFDKFYRMFNSIQGKQNLYYTGALGSFELVERSMRHTKAVLSEFL